MKKHNIAIALFLIIHNYAKNKNHGNRWKFRTKMLRVDLYSTFWSGHWKRSQSWNLDWHMWHGELPIYRHLNSGRAALLALRFSGRTAGRGGSESQSGQFTDHSPEGETKPSLPCRTNKTNIGFIFTNIINIVFFLHK